MNKLISHLGRKAFLSAVTDAEKSVIIISLCKGPHWTDDVIRKIEIKRSFNGVDFEVPYGDERGSLGKIISNSVAILEKQWAKKIQTEHDFKENSTAALQALGFSE